MQKLHTQCEFNELTIRGRGMKKTGQCRFAAERLVRSRTLTGAVYMPACASHLLWIESKDPDATTRPVHVEPVNRPVLQPCRVRRQAAASG